MFKAIQKSKARKGFTLVELIVVISIIAILLLILVPTLLGYLKNARTTKAAANAKTAYNAVTAEYTALAGKDKTPSNGSDLVSSAKADGLLDNDWNVTASISAGTVTYATWAQSGVTAGTSIDDAYNEGKWGRWPDLT